MEEFRFFMTFIFVGLFFTIVVNIIFSSHYKKKQDETLKRLEGKILSSKEYVKCESFGSGGRSSSFRFNRCDIYVLEDAVFIAGYVKFFSLKIYNSSVLLTKNPDKYVPLSFHTIVEKPNKVNSNSFNGAVYIDFGELGWNKTNISLRLLGLTEDDKQFFNCLIVS